MKLIIWCLILIASFVNVAAQTNIHISGNITGIPNYNPLDQVKVILYRLDDNTVVDSTYSNQDGNYTMDFLWVNREEMQVNSNRSYPNPYSAFQELYYDSKREGNRQIVISDIQGNILLSEQVYMKAGGNNIRIEGGVAGTKVITISDQQSSTTNKSIQTQSTGLPIKVSVQHYEVPLKSFISDQVKLEFSKDGFLLNDTTFTLTIEQTINQQLQQILFQFSTTIEPFLETGEQVTLINPQYSIKVKWPDSTTNTFYLNDSIISIEKELYPLDQFEPGNAVFYHDTATYFVNGLPNKLLNWMIFRRPKQKTNRPNIAQNETAPGPLIPDYVTIVSLDSLNNSTNYLYTVRSRAETQTGEYEYLNSEFSKGLIASAGGGLRSSTFVDLSQYTNIDTLDIVQKGYNETTGQPMPQEDLDRAMNLLMMALETRYLPNGDTLLPPHRIYIIENTADPRWQALIARGFDNCIRTIYYNGPPQISREFATSYTYNGAMRPKTSGARYSITNADGQIFEESFSAVTFEEEGSGGLAPFVWNGSTSQPSQYAKSISTIPALLNLGTGMEVKVKE